MVKYILDAILAAMISTVLFTSMAPANAAGAIILNSQGQYAGNAMNLGKNIVVHGADGQYVGSVMPVGKSAVILNKSGGLDGIVMPNGAGSIDIPALPPLQ
jgi:glutamate synthase domain-containing protein 3